MIRRGKAPRCERATRHSATRWASPNHHVWPREGDTKKDEHVVRCLHAALSLSLCVVGVVGLGVGGGGRSGGGVCARDQGAARAGSAHAVARPAPRGALAVLRLLVLERPLGEPDAATSKHTRKQANKQTNRQTKQTKQTNKENKTKKEQGTGQGRRKVSLRTCTRAAASEHRGGMHGTQAWMEAPRTQTGAAGQR